MQSRCTAERTNSYYYFDAVRKYESIQQERRYEVECRVECRSECRSEAGMHILSRFRVAVAQDLLLTTPERIELARCHSKKLIGPTAPQSESMPAASTALSVAPGVVV